MSSILSYQTIGKCPLFYKLFLISLKVIPVNFLTALENCETLRYPQADEIVLAESVVFFISAIAYSFLFRL